MRRQTSQRRKSEFDTRVIDLSRVTKVGEGGKRLRFRACVVAGDHKGRVGVGVAKAQDVQYAVSKASSQAERKMMQVKIVNDTIPHFVKAKYAAAEVLLRPAVKGHGLIAGGVVRTVLELAGVKNIVSKILGSKNKINNAHATLAALQKIKKI